MNNQHAAFTQALYKVQEVLGKDIVKVDVLLLHNLRETTWTLKRLVDWLLGGHVHFILGHIHQGMESFGWSITDIYYELERLTYHQGKS